MATLGRDIGQKDYGFCNGINLRLPMNPLTILRQTATVCLVVLAICASAGAAPADVAQPSGLDSDGRLARTPQILVIFSDDPSQPWIRQATDAIVATEQGPRRVSPAWFFEHLDAVRFPDRERERQFQDALRAKIPQPSPRPGGVGRRQRDPIRPHRAR